MIAPSQLSQAYEAAPRFQVLSLAGGGYRGLYTAQIVADLEERLGAPIATRFDLIAGTSVGGILALALALEIPASRIVELFAAKGDSIFSKRLNLFRVLRSRFSAAKLQRLLAAEYVFLGIWCPCALCIRCSDRQC